MSATQKSLAVLSDDVLSLITSHIVDQDIGTMWFTGDAALQNRMRNGGVKDFVFVRCCRRPLGLWPHIVSQFLGLRTFYFKGNVKTNRFVSYPPQVITAREIGTLSPNLLSLTLRGNVALHRTALAFIVDRFPGIHSLDLPIHPSRLSDSFPKLQFLANLRLSALGMVELSSFEKLSKTVTKMELIGMTFDGRVLELPPSVTELEIRPESAHLFEISAGLRLILPPRLTALSFYCFGSWLYKAPEMWPTLPKTLTQVELRVQHDALSPSLVALLPRSLRHLRLIPTLTDHFKLQPEHCEMLPLGLESLDFGVIHSNLWDRALDDVLPKTLRSLKTVVVRDGLKLPQNLTRLVCRYGHRLVHTLELPPSLTEFVCPTEKETLSFSPEHLPINLKKMCARLRVPSKPTFSSPHLASATFYVPNVSILEYLPMSLTKLKVGLLGYHGIEEHQLWSAQLPRTLTSLAVRAPVAHEWFEYLPPLKTLIVFTEDEKHQKNNMDTTLKPLTHECLALVPHSITDLFLQLNTIPVDEALPLLENHQRLQILTLSSKNPTITTQRIQWNRLPKSLGRIQFYFPTFDLISKKENTCGIEVRFIKGDDPRVLF